MSNTIELNSNVSLKLIGIFKEQKLQVYRLVFKDFNTTIVSTGTIHDKKFLDPTNGPILVTDTYYKEVKGTLKEFTFTKGVD